jgi:hypothetical protein
MEINFLNAEFTLSFCTTSEGSTFSSWGGISGCKLEDMI